MRLNFSACGQRWTIVCDPDRARRTLGTLCAVLPLDLQLHTPKIAGSHIYWHAPFVEDAEGGVDVLQAEPGAFIYWPGRQFLELTFAPLQAETARITVLGRIESGLGRLAELGAALRTDHGCRPFDGRLALIDGTQPIEPPPTPGVPDDLRERRQALWVASPDDVTGLTRSRALMHPAGPVFTAEAEARVLHELLWWVRGRRTGQDEILLRYTAALACNKAATRLRDFCHFGPSATLLFDLEHAFGSAAIPLGPLLDEAILVAGRLAAWLDLLIPWSGINDAMRRAYDESEAAPRVHRNQEGNR